MGAHSVPLAHEVVGTDVETLDERGEAAAFMGANESDGVLTIPYYVS